MLLKNNQILLVMALGYSIGCLFSYNSMHHYGTCAAITRFG